ncbi:MAG: response regulator transcription factor [Hyphomicrobiales bacterium]|nr:response regulator transcription factor [Hyphomicrobiales bacterium]
MTRILIVDDHPMFREAVRNAVRDTLPNAFISEASSVAEAAEHANAAPDAILLDLMLPGVSGFDGLMLMRSRFPHAPILIFSGLGEPKIAAQAIRLGAAGFVPKSADKAALSGALADVLDGRIHLPDDLGGQVRALLAEAKGESDVVSRVAELTPSQIRVLQLLRQGLLNKQIAHALDIRERTVKAHISEILRKLNVVSRTQVVIETAHLNFDALTAREPHKN